MAGPRIMIVEDEGITAKDLQRSLEDIGYSVTSIASSGAEALDNAERDAPDLVLMDISIEGGMDGIEAASEVRSRFDIPVIYVTAYADSETLGRAKVTEPFGYIVKPFKDRELRTTIEVALYKHGMEKEVRESRELLSSTLKSIGDAVISTDQNGFILFMNPLAEFVTGWNQENAMGRPLGEIFNILDPESEESASHSIIRDVLRSGSVKLARYTLIARNGERVLIENSASPVKDRDENVIGATMDFRDLREREG